MIISNFHLFPLIHWPYYSGENKAALIVDGLLVPGTYFDRQPVQILCASGFMDARIFIRIFSDAVLLG